MSDIQRSGERSGDNVNGVVRKTLVFTKVSDWRRQDPAAHTRRLPDVQRLPSLLHAHGHDGMTMGAAGLGRGQG